MRQTTSATKAAWESGTYVGSNRPMVRVTIQRLSVMLSTRGSQVYSSIAHGQAAVPAELPNVQSVRWNRATENSVATMSMKLYNTAPLPLGSVPDPEELDRPGFYSPRRGTTVFSSRWNHLPTAWQGLLVPDRLLRTYEGYGFDPNVIPENDPHLYQSGLWMIDDVTFDTDGMISVEARDVGRALVDQILMPPVVPMASYPLTFEKGRSVPNPDQIVTSGTGWQRPTYDSDSNVYWIGSSKLYGHHGRDAFDSSNSSYWLSIGNTAPDRPWSFEWVQGKFSSRTVGAVRVRTWGGPYRAYVSVWADGKWQGTKDIPYQPAPDSGPNHSKIRYSYSFTANEETVTSFKFPKPVPGATRVRVTFTKLARSSYVGAAGPTSSGKAPYRAGVRNLEVSGEVSTTVDGGTHPEPRTSPPRIQDYTDIVKILLAYAGWYWPMETTRSFRTLSDGTRVVEAPTALDNILHGNAANGTTGRVWGDFEASGTYPVAPIGVSAFDKKPVMEGVVLVRDTLGFLFFIDEEGGAVFRSPNIWSVGNWIGTGAATAGRTTEMVTIDERTTLLGLSSTYSSRSIRERIFVGNLAGQVAGMSPGHNPYPSGLRRIGGWTDQHFTTVAECQRMADLVSLRQLFTYQTDKVRIAGNPAIQIDDQVRIYERITEEGYLHYVTGISMDWSLETGRYTYELSTHWLGDTPFSNWTFDPATLSAETRAYLQALGKIS